jgi:hypothetical protein
MQPSPAFVPSDPHRLARAFLALGDDAAPSPAQQSVTRMVVALVAVVALALSAPMTWSAPRAKVGELPAATLGNSKALLAAADDEDDDAAD